MTKVQNEGDARRKDAAQLHVLTEEDVEGLGNVTALCEDTAKDVTALCEEEDTAKAQNGEKAEEEEEEEEEEESSSFFDDWCKFVKVRSRGVHPV